MWRSEITRRDLFELISTGRPWLALPTTDDDLFDSLPDRPRVVEARWNVDPARERSFPVVIIVHDEEVNDFLAAVNSSNSGPTPLSAFSRIVTKTEALRYFRTRKCSGIQTALQGLIGLSFGEAIRYADGRIQETELTPAICKRTIAYGWAKALSNGISIEQLDSYISHWTEAQTLTSTMSRVHLPLEQSDNLHTILQLASRVFYENSDSSDPIETLCEALVNSDTRLMERAWEAATRSFPQRFTLAEFASSTREDRSTQFYSFLEQSKLNKSIDRQSGYALSAFLASQISPGTFEHMPVLRNHDASLSLWFSFIVGLQQPRGILGFSGGLGSRLQRDINRRERFKDGPIADISLRELRILARAGLEPISKRLGHSNEIEVEVIPLVTCSFRFQNLQNKQIALFDPPAPSPAVVDDDSKERQLKSLKKIMAAVEELSIQIGAESDISAAKSTKRTRKR
jgi:hypothetical protein